MIKKDKFIEFVDKYSFNNRLHSVTWKVVTETKTLRTRGELDSKSLTMDVTLKGFEEFGEDVRIPIATTPKIKPLLLPFDDEVELKLNKMGDRILGFSISDANCESYCAASDISVIPPVSKSNIENATYSVQIDLSEDFVGRFLKARAALVEVDGFSIRKNKAGQVEFILGNSIPNSNRITLLAPIKDGVDTYNGNLIRFPINNIIDLLKANKEMPSGILSLSENNGVIKIQYSNDQFDCSYWQLAYVK
jgi:hypothetical protein